MILATGRIVGETAALIFTTGTVAQIPDSVMGSGRTLAVHLYALWNEGLNTDKAYATAVVLLVIVAAINTLSAFVAKKSRKGKPMEDKTKFDIKNLNLFYGDFQALKNISLRIPSQEITAFIGPSGCGKSTLLKTLNRMNDLVEGCRTDGEILLDGEDIRKTDPNLLRRRVGMVFQKPNPFPTSVYDNIAYGPRTHGVKSKAKLDEIVERSLRDAAILTRSKTG